MRVLHLISTSLVSGPEKLLFDGVPAQRRRGVDARLGLVVETRLGEKGLGVLKAAGERSLPTLGLPTGSRFSPDLVRRLVGLMRSERVDLLHCHGPKADLLGLLAGTASRTSWLATHHGWIGLEAKRRLYERLDAACLRRAARVVAVSRDAAERLAARGVPRRLIEVVHNAVPSAASGPSGEARPAGRPFTMGLAGRLSPEKGIGLFLEALASVRERLPEFRALIAGEGPEREALVEKTRALGLDDQVVFAGYVREMDRFYRGLDLLLMPSFTEGLPMTLLEAQGAGLPVLASAVGGVPEAIEHSANGWLVPAGSREALGEAMVHLSRRPDLLDALGREARRRIEEKFSIDAWAARHGEIYERVIHG